MLPMAMADAKTLFRMEIFMKMEKSLTRKIKYKALLWLRIDQRCAFIATEAGPFLADCLGVAEKKMIEVEVKISLSDLKADFKKNKHRTYLVSTCQYNLKWIPTHFYYAVPGKLVDAAQALLVEHKREEYGIINADLFNVVRRAKWMHKRESESSVKFSLALRMGSELIRFHEAWV